MRLSRVAASLLGVLLSALPLSAAIQLSTTTPYVQRFDDIGTAATAPLPADFRADRLTGSANVRSVGSFASAGTATTQAGAANISATASNGIYNYGAGTTTAGTPERAIGFIASGSSTQSGNLYANFVNNTGSSISGLTISYDVEKYRGGSNSSGFRFQLFYSADGVVWTTAGSDFTTSFAPDANNSGFANVPAATISVTNVPLPVSIANGSQFFLAWNYSVASGTTTTNAPGFGIDNISVLGIAGGPVSQNPNGAGSASPPLVLPGNSTTLSVVVTPGANPTSTGIAVTADLSPIGGPTVSFTEGPANTFTYSATVSSSTAPGAKSIAAAISDAQGRSGSATIAVTVDQPPLPADHVVISQIYGGGGNTNASFNHDFVELYNPSTTRFELTGWTLQYAPATSGTNTTGSLTVSLAGFIEPGEYYLVQLAGGTEGSDLPVRPNISAEINISQSAGKLALINTGDILTAQCPNPDARIVDYVGYGTTANCHEGSANAPAPSATTAILRKQGGAIDTNQNGNDFATGTPNPRRTAIIAEVGPHVVSVDPAPGNTLAPKDASVTVNFSEPVNVDQNWFSITCGSTGSHNDATVANSGTTWVITPNVNFAPSEQCTVTIVATAVHDVDTDDATPGTDTLAKDFTSSFTVTTAATYPYTTDVHLTMGNPNNAIDSVSTPNNYLMMKPAFALSYNRDLGRPNWVSWHLTPEWYGSLTRIDTFRPDPAVPALDGWYRVQATDFFNTGFDRGHMCPNADRDGQNEIVQATFLMTNMVAQAPDNNQGPWANMENALRTIASAGNELFIIAGPAGVGGTGSNGFAQVVAGGHVTVPSSTWKVVLVLPQQSGNDVARVNAATQTIAVIMTNQQGIRTSDQNDWKAYLTTVRAVEQLTGYNFFSNVPQTIQNAIENGVNGNNPPGASDQSLNVREDDSRTFDLDVAIPNNDAVTVQIATSVTNGTLSVNGTSVTYTPAPNYFGSDSFTYQLIDGTKHSNTATVSFTVLEVNDAPVAADDNKSTNEDTPLTFAASDLTANDSAGPANESTQALTIDAVSPTADTHGSVTLISGNITYTPAPDYNGTASFTYHACDNGTTAGQNDPLCTSATVHLTINPVNDPPIAAISTVATSIEGTAINATVAVTDVDDTLFTYAWTVTKNGVPYANATATSINFTPDDNGTYIVSVVVSDPNGGTGSDSKTVVVTNAAPLIASVSGPTSSISLGSVATIQLAYSDAGTADTHSATATWDDGTTSVASCANGACTASHTFAAAGVYAVNITLADDDGATAAAQFDYVIVTDANAGAVTGGGWIITNGTKVTFATNAKYLKNETAPQGNTEVQAPSMNFKAKSIAWLVVSGRNAQYSGSGTINGAGSYRYIVTVADGEVDKFRIRIWDATNGTTLFDNVAGASDDIDSANPQPIGGGNITIH